MAKSTIVFLICSCSFAAFSQRQVEFQYGSNIGFEEYKALPDSEAQFYKLKNWGTVIGSPDYFYDSAGSKKAYERKGYAALEIVCGNKQPGEMIQTGIARPENYYKYTSSCGWRFFTISLYVKFVPSKSNCAVDAICGFFGNSYNYSFNADKDSSGINALEKKLFKTGNMFKLRKNDKSRITDTTWTRLSAVFQGTSESYDLVIAYLCLGNFFDKEFIKTTAGTLKDVSYHAYYLIDNFSIIGTHDFEKRTK